MPTCEDHDVPIIDLKKYEQTCQLTKLLRERWEYCMKDSDVLNSSSHTLSERRLQIRLAEGSIDHIDLSVCYSPSRRGKRKAAKIFTALKTPFRVDEFNFLNIPQHEHLLHIESGSDRHWAIVNKWAVNKYHGLFLPFPTECLPQVITLEALQAAFDFYCATRDSDLVLIYNSLMAAGSVNHLHFQFLRIPNVHNLPAVVRAVNEARHTDVFQPRVVSFPLSNFLLFHFRSAVCSREHFCTLVHNACSVLLRQNFAHHIVFLRVPDIPDDQLIVLLFPRVPNKTGTIVLDGFDFTTVFTPAALECLGFVIVTSDRASFDQLSDSQILAVFDSVAVSQAEMNGIADAVRQMNGQ